MRKLYCRSLPSDHKGTCGKNGIKTCVGSIRKMIETNTGKPLPKGYGIKCDKCTAVPPKPGYIRMHQCACQYDC